MLAVLDEDIVWNAPNVLPQRSRWPVVTTLRSSFKASPRLGKSFGLEIDDVVASGDRVCMYRPSRWHNRRKEGELRLRARWTLRDGVCVRFDEYVDTHPAGRRLAFRVLNRGPRRGARVPAREPSRRARHSPRRRSHPAEPRAREHGRRGAGDHLEQGDRLQGAQPASRPWAQACVSQTASLGSGSSSRAVLRCSRCQRRWTR